MQKRGRGRPKNPPALSVTIRDIIPTKELFSEEEEQMYRSLMEVYLQDFDVDDLTSSDFDDIIALATNKILSIRLLKSSKDNIGKQLDVATAIEKLDRRTEKIKESLSSRRKDRLDPNELKGFSIVDLAVAFDADAKAITLERVNKLREEEKEMLKKRASYKGNRYDRATLNDKKE